MVASALPYILNNWFDVANTAAAGEIPPAVKYSFYAGGVVLFASVLWTVMRSTEYSPAQLAAFEAAEQQQQHSQLEPLNQRFYWQSGTVFAVLGLGALVLVYQFSLDQQLYVLGGCLLAFGLLQYLASQLKKQQFNTEQAGSQANTGMLVQIVDDLFSMPQRMKQLAVVQFFSWFALFAMWIYTTAAVTSVHYGSSDPTSAAYNDGADWVGLLFAIYNGFAAIAAIVIPWVVKRSSLQISHSLNLLCGALGLLSFLWIKDPSLVMAVDDWCWYCLGLNPISALCLAGRLTAQSQNGRLHGHV